MIGGFTMLDLRFTIWDERVWIGEVGSNFGGLSTCCCIVITVRVGVRQFLK